jgi:hypothetical protein
VNSRYYLTFESIFQSEKPKKLEKASLNVKFFDWDYLHLIALMKESYFTYLLLALHITVCCFRLAINDSDSGKVT